MQIIRKLVLSALCLVIASCISQQVTATPVTTNMLLPSATFTAHPTNTPLPASIVEGAFRSGMSPEEVVSFYLEIHSYIENNDINAVAEKIYFPISECGRNKGDKIETKDEFIQRFNEIFNDDDSSIYLNANLDDAFIDMYGVRIGGVWYLSICKENTCNNTKILIVGIGNYCSFRISAPTTAEGATTEAAQPDYPESQFVFGDYQLASYRSVGGSLMSKEDVEKFRSVLIEKNKYSTDTACHFGCTCPSPEYEFNKPFYGEGHALWYGIPAFGELIVICDGEPIAYFDILTDSEIGYYFDGYYFKLKHK